ncbi:MAG: hypothetical protein FJZ00_05725, partial [Candidatus Sericytochromatia bacterium]|nr:hypothetical protein [Candidatus Tanganyikabacteria bacterium]
INGTAYDLTQIRAAGWGAETVTAEAPVNFPRGADLEVDIVAEQLPSGRHNLYFKVQTAEFGPLKVEVYDRI